MAGKKIGYARSAMAGDTDAQCEKLQTAGCVAVFTDSGKVGSADSRPGFKAALAALQAGDTLMVCDIKRLSREAAEVMQVIDDLWSQRIVVQSLDHSDARVPNLRIVK